MSRFDRDDVVAATDLWALATELLGEPVGSGRAAKWRCPTPTHEDLHPSTSVYDGPKGARWNCFGCGAGGSCIDLWMHVHRVGFAAALETLAARNGIPPSAEQPPHGRRQPRVVEGSAPALSTAPDLPRSRHQGPPPPPIIRPANPEIERYVAAAAEALWTPHGYRGREWLAARGLDDEAILRANRIGFDPGPRRLRRGAGLPKYGNGIVFPALSAERRAVYFQLRQITERDRPNKYLNPAENVAPNPRTTLIRTAEAPLAGDVTIIAEGVPDALAAAHAGYRAIAVLGAWTINGDVADSVAAHHRDTSGHTIVVAFDDDDAGRTNADKLLGLLATRLQDATLIDLTPPGGLDLNAWRQVDRHDCDHALAAATRPGPALRRSPLGAVRAIQSPPPVLEPALVR